MRVLDERSSLYGHDVTRVIEANPQLLVMPEARDRTPATIVHDVRSHAAEDIRFGMRYRDAVTTGEGGMPVLGLTKIGALEPNVGERQEQGWAEREESAGDPEAFQALVAMACLTITGTNFSIMACA